MQTTNSFLNNDNEFLLQELDSYEASMISGGFSITNNTDRRIRFYPFAQDLPPTERTLEPNNSGDYNGSYVLFDADPGNPFEPVVRPVNNDGIYSFVVEGGKRDLIGAAFFRRP